MKGKYVLAVVVAAALALATGAATVTRTVAGEVKHITDGITWTDQVVFARHYWNSAGREQHALGTRSATVRVAALGVPVVHRALDGRYSAALHCPTPVGSGGSSWSVLDVPYRTVTEFPVSVDMQVEVGVRSHRHQCWIYMTIDTKVDEEDGWSRAREVAVPVEILVQHTTE